MKAVYDPKDTMCSVNGLVLVGVAPDGYALTTNTDAVTQIAGLRGDVVISKSADNTGALTVTLSAQSTSCRMLDRWASARESCALVLRNSREGATYSDAEAYIQKAPDVAYGTEAGTKAYVFLIADTTPRYDDDTVEA